MTLQTAPAGTDSTVIAGQNISGQGQIQEWPVMSDFQIALIRGELEDAEIATRVQMLEISHGNTRPNTRVRVTLPLGSMEQDEALERLRALGVLPNNSAISDFERLSEENVRLTYVIL